MPLISLIQSLLPPQSPPAIPPAEAEEEEMPDELITTLLHFNEGEGFSQADETGGLDELYAGTGGWPTDTSGPLGRALQFTGALPTYLVAQDLLVGGTLHQRSMTFQALLSWDFTAQNAAGVTGTLIARGKGTNADEYMPFAIELRVVDVATRVGEARFLWHTVAGVLKTELGGQFIVPAANEFFLLTCTRRWVSPTSVVLRYYVGKQLIAEINSADGDIGGGVDGTTSIGGRFTGAAYANFFEGVLDEMLLADYEMSLEEIEAQWLRLSLYEPDGYRMLLEAMQPGLPITNDPASRVQRDLQSMGHILGFANARTENMRDNFIPSRAYGKTLVEWEKLTKAPRKPGDSIETRRDRVIGRLRRHGGVSPPAVQETEKDLLAAAPEQLQVIAFSQQITDDFSTLKTERWIANPSADWDVTGGELRVQDPGGAVWTYDGNILLAKMCLLTVERGLGAQLYAKLDPQALAANAECGIVFHNWSNNSAFFVGIRNVAGAYKLGYQRVRYGVTGPSDGAFVVLENMAGLAPRFVRLRADAVPDVFAPQDTNHFAVSYAAAAPADETGFTTTYPLDWNSNFDWAGFYYRTFGITAAATDFRFNDLAYRDDWGFRPFYFYVFRDPAIPGSPDLSSALRVLRQLKHAHTHAAVITSKSLLCDDPASVCDGGPMGCL